ncbi:MAG TPA: efflux RND transporter periplasmic adaptor subunit [Gemmatimonadaceae bacterium]|nr:efflux RND transporter periplasmic adaptor subunit [Gemmatimonadaceae bacterium]
MKKIAIAGVAIALGAAGTTAWLYKRADAKEAPAYRTAAVTRGSLKSTVSATGTLQAVRTVQVGTQVSGQIAQIYVDFNDKVKKSELLARIDPTLQQQAVQDAEAQLEKTQATLKQAQDEYARNKQLLDAKVITASEFSTVQSNFAVQQASVKSAEIALQRAKQNLAYTSIYAPIDGVIVERNVDVGQTVAASLSAPQLFLIANDLGEMQILASVDESDIGQIKEGQPVQFTVQSYPNDRFTGTVRQVRLQSTTQDNVVNYTAVIGVKNPNGKLLPGMTATVQFLTASADNVLTVPNAALHLTATPEMLASLRNGRTQGGGGGVDSAQAQQWRQRMQSAQGAQVAPTSGAARSGTRTMPPALWYLDSANTLHRVRVTAGLSDGQRTEVSGEGVQEGMQVIIGVSATETTAAAAPSVAASQSGTNPFQPARPAGGFRRGP